MGILLTGVAVLTVVTGSAPAGSPAAASESVGKRATNTPVRLVGPVTFTDLPSSWRMWTSRPVKLTRSGAMAESTAVSWQHRRDNPLGWLGVLPRDGAGVAAILVRRAADSASRKKCGYPVRASGYLLRKRSPIRLSELRAGRADGQTRTLDLRLRANIERRYTLDLIVEFGRLRPTTGLRRAVDRLLSSIVLPAWPKSC